MGVQAQQTRLITENAVSCFLRKLGKERRTDAIRTGRWAGHAQGDPAFPLVMLHVLTFGSIRLADLKVRLPYNCSQWANLSDNQRFVKRTADLLDSDQVWRSRSRLKRKGSGEEPDREI